MAKEKHTSLGCDTGENTGAIMAKSETIPDEDEAENVVDTTSKVGDGESSTRPFFSFFPVTVFSPVPHGDKAGFVAGTTSKRVVGKVPDQHFLSSHLSHLRTKQNPLPARTPLLRKVVGNVQPNLYFFSPKSTHPFHPWTRVYLDLRRPPVLDRIPGKRNRNLERPHDFGSGPRRKRRIAFFHAP